MTTNFQPLTPPDQPVVSSTSPAPHMVSYSSPYLPAGAPPWPTTVLQRPARTTTGSLDTVAGKIAGRKSRSARRVFIVLGLIALTLLVGVGLTYGILYFDGQIAADRPSTSHPVTIAKVTPQSTTGASSSTPATSGLPAPTSFSVMSSNHQKSIGVLVKYPSDWIEEPPAQPAQDGTSVAVFHPQQQLGIAVYVGKFSVVGSGVTTTTALNQRLISTIYSGGSSTGTSGNTNLQAVPSTTPRRTIAGEQWDEQDATFSDTNSVLMRIASITIRHGSFFYSFIFQAPDMYYSDVSMKYIPPMLNSFKFLP
ncbi:MAG: hypothetical protein NVS9B9_28500 [Ktedonobacteraceae bacterium]